MSMLPSSQQPSVISQIMFWAFMFGFPVAVGFVLGWAIFS